MKRRQLLSIVAVVPLAGCAALPQILGTVSKALGWGRYVESIVRGAESAARPFVDDFLTDADRTAISDAFDSTYRALRVLDALSAAAEDASVNGLEAARDEVLLAYALLRSLLAKHGIMAAPSDVMADGSTFEDPDLPSPEALRAIW